MNLLSSTKRIKIHAVGIVARGKGESLVEVIISVGILMMIIGPAAALVVSGNSASAKNKNLMIAEHLAQSGIDMMKSLYDTNVQRFSGKATLCWHTRPDFATFDTCQNNVLSTGSYRMRSLPGNISFERMGESRRLSENLTAQTDGDYSLKLNADGLYVHDEGEPTLFYRELNITLTNADIMQVESIVRFKVGSKIKQVIQNLILTKP